MAQAQRHEKAYWRRVLLTGASGGIGAALLAELAAPGTTIYALGRDAARLRRAAEAAEAKGASVVRILADVTDRDAMEGIVRDAWAEGPLDLVIANAGVTGGVGPDGQPEDPALVREIVDVNLHGVLNAVLPALSLMLQAGRGQIALMSSLAGFVGLPFSPAYSMTKAAVRAYGEGLRLPAGRAGVNVTVICPGYIDTPMDDRVAVFKPVRLPPARAARIIVRGLRKNRARIVFPFALWMGVRFLMALPMGVAQRIMATQRRAHVRPANPPPPTGKG